MKKLFEGNLEITKENAGEYKELVEVTGYLRIHSEAKLDAPELETVGGDLNIYSNAKLDAPELETVGGSFYIDSEAKLDALETVGGDLYIHSKAKLDAPELKTVGGYLYIYPNAKLDAPELKTVGGSLFINSEANLVANDQVKSNVSKEELAKALKKQGLIQADGILAFTKGRVTKQKSGVTTQKIQVVGKTTTSYLARKGEHSSHGATIEEALLDLKFKTSKRDVSVYKKWKLSAQKPLVEMAFAYRQITGACRQGTEEFLKQLKNKKKTYSFAEVKELTKGHYGHEQLCEFLGNTCE